MLPIIFSCQFIKYTKLKLIRSNSLIINPPCMKVKIFSLCCLEVLIVIILENTESCFSQLYIVFLDPF